MKLCPHCASSLEDNSVKCPRCGKWVVQKRDGNTSNGKRTGARKQLVLLCVLVLFGWALWRIPEIPINIREPLNLKPNLALTLGAMESDLETLKALQARYFQIHGSYSGSRSILGFEASPGVDVSIIATPSGWSAGATHGEFPKDQGCAVYEGSGRPPQSPVSPTEPGSVECTGRVG